MNALPLATYQVSAAAKRWLLFRSASTDAAAAAEGQGPSSLAAAHQEPAGQGYPSRNRTRPNCLAAHLFAPLRRTSREDDASVIVDCCCAYWAGHKCRARLCCFPILCQTHSRETRPAAAERQRSLWQLAPNSCQLYNAPHAIHTEWKPRAQRSTPPSSSLYMWV